MRRARQHAPGPGRIFQGLLEDSSVRKELSEIFFDTFDALRKWFSKSKNLDRVVYALLLYCLVSFVFGVIDIRKPPAPPKNYSSIHIVIHGKITPPEGGDFAILRRAPEALKIYFSFPEVPLDLSMKSEALNIRRSGEYEAALSFFARKVPSHYSLRVRMKGCEEKELKDLQLSGAPLESTVPEIKLQKAAEQKKAGT